ncbi:MAG: hypothetical protein JXA53_12370 [Bacteroidales bacterium]|nr:hypothetical protein [Bacteroidales bacterium]
MISLNREIGSVKTFKVYKNECFYITVNNDLFDLNGNTIGHNCNSVFQFGIWLVFLNSIKKTTVVYNINEKTISFEIDGFISLGPSEKNTVNKSLFLATYRYQSFKYSAFFDCNNFSMLSKIKHNEKMVGVSVLLDTVLLFYKDNRITCYSIMDYETLWQLSFQELTGVENIELHSDLVVVGNKLFFYLTNRLHNGVASTFCVDINTGKLIKEIPEFTGDVKLFDGMLYTAVDEDIEIMNPETFNVEKFNIKSEMDKNDLQRIDYARWVVSDNKLYFGQNFGAHQAKVGVVDLRTMKITDKHVFPRKCGSIGTIKVSGNKLYVHTQDETLHIFEV